VTGNISGTVSETGTINLLKIGGSLTSTGVINAVNSSNPAVGSITTLTIGGRLSGTINVSGQIVNFNLGTGPGSYLVGTQLWLVGANVNNQVHVQPVGTSSTGST